MMLPEVCIRRPVLAAMLNLGLILFGLIGLSRLPVRELPDVDPPIVNVNTVYPGASSAVMETQVTEPIEEALASIEGIRTLTSESRDQVSSITIEFNLSRDIELAAQDVRDRVARVRGRLPEDINEPIVVKQDADAQPMLWIALYSDRLSTLELTTLAENVLKDRLQTVPGVSSLLLGGAKRFAIRLWLNSEKMAASGVTVLDVQRALAQQSVELPSGRVESRQRELAVETKGELKTPEEYNQLVLKQRGNEFVRLRDVGFAAVGVEDERSQARYNSLPSMGIGIIKQSKANTIEVARAVKQELERLKPLLPEGVKTYIPYDESVFVKQSIDDVWQNLWMAFLLVVVTIYFFLGDVRSTVVPAVAIPISLVATFGCLHLFGYSVNIVTMLAMVLAIGEVVDDAILVVENIYRHTEEGKSPMEAAFIGMKEITFAIISTTVALIAVFLPLAFQTTTTGRLFIELAVTVSVAVAISAFVALTLSPMMASRLLRPLDPNRPKRGLLALFERIMKRLTNRYERGLRWSFRHPVFIILLTVGSLALSLFFFLNLEKEFLPDEDKGRMLAFVIAPEGSTSEYTDRMVKKMEGVLGGTPEIEGFFSAVALSRGGIGRANEGLAFVRLKEERDRSLQDIVGGPNGLAAQFFRTIEGAIAIPILPRGIGASFGQPFQLVLQHQNLDTLNGFSQELSAKLQAAGFLMNVRPVFRLDKPQLKVNIDRDRAAALGVSVEDLSRTLQILFGGLDLSRVHIGGKEYEVIAQLEREARLTPSDLDAVRVRSANGELIQLSNVVSYEIEGGPSAISHYNRLRSAAIEGTPVGVKLGTAIQRTEDMLKRDLPPGFRYEWAGEARDLKSSGRETLFVLILAIFIIYMVLASQFESLVHPFTVMLTLPLAGTGALGLLWLLAQVNSLGTGMYFWSQAPNHPPVANILANIVPRIPAMSFNLFSQIGMILLLGLVTKNGILLVEFANQQMEKGKNALEAMLISGRLRLRPIMMTALANIVGAIPIVLGFGEGAESRRPLGVATLGGMTISTMLTLFVIPVMYVLINRAGKKMREFRIRRHAQAAVVLLVCGMLAAGTAGCSVGPNYRRPELFVPQAWSAAGHGDIELFLRKIETSPAAAWWKEFRDPLLNSLIERAVKGNFDLHIAQARVLESRAARGISKGNLLPALDGTGAYSRTHPARSGVSPVVSRSDYELFEAEFDASWEIDLFGGGRRRLEAAAADILAAEESRRDVLISVMAEAARNYVEVRSYQRRLQIARDNLAVQQKALAITRTRFEGGLSGELDVAQANALLASTQANVPLLEAALAQAQNRLAVLLGLPPGALEKELAAGADIPPAPPEVPVGLPSELMLRRPDIRAAERRLAAASARIGAAIADYFPKISLTGSFGYENIKASDWFASGSRFWSYGPAVQWRIFDAGRIRNNVRVQTQRERQALAEYEKTALEAFEDVENALTAYAKERLRYQSLQGAALSYRRAADIANERYTQGISDFLNVLDARRSLYQAQDQLVQSERTICINLISLYKALGGGWQAE